MVHTLLQQLHRQCYQRPPENIKNIHQKHRKQCLHSLKTTETMSIFIENNRNNVYIHWKQRKQYSPDPRWDNPPVDTTMRQGRTQGQLKWHYFCFIWRTIGYMLIISIYKHMWYKCLASWMPLSVQSPILDVV